MATIEETTYGTIPFGTSHLVKKVNVVDPSADPTFVEETVTQDPEMTAIPTGSVRTTKVVRPVIRTEHPQQVYETKKTIFRAYQVIWYIVGVIEVLLVFRMLFKAIGANPFSGFVTLIYALTNPFALPFQGIISNYVVGTSVFEWPTAIAAIVYFILAWGIVYLLQLIKPVTPDEVVESVDNP